MRRRFARCAALLLLALPAGTAPLVGAARPVRAAPPPEDRCPAIGGATPGGVDDAVPMRLQAGQIVSFDALPALRDLLPDEIWQNRHVFFHPGMRLVIGDCHRRYPIPRFYRQASERFADRVSLDRDGNLRGYVAGVPFPAEEIDPEAPDAALRWAWNLVHRFRGAGPVGNFRIADIPPRIGPVLTYEGFFFLYQTRHRADLAASDYSVPESDRNLFVAGGRFLEPQSARHLAWRQMRPEEAARRYSLSDRIFVYVPTMRKVRRAATGWVDGMYVPRYRVAGDSGGGGVPLGGQLGPGGVIHPDSASSAAQTEHLPRGFTLLTLRPNAYVWRLRGERELLAPLNGVRPGFPVDPERNFGPHGLSVASDRWDVRWAVVIEGRSRVREQHFESIVLYVDWQTLQPLYAVTRARMGRILDVGILVHRFSGDVVNYPGWGSGEPADVFDPVAEVFYHVADDSGWRRESYNVRSTPAEERVRRRFTSTDFLVRGK